MKKLLLAATFALTSFGTAAAVQAGGGADEATGSIGINGSVPVYCVADLSDMPANIAIGDELGWDDFTQSFNFMIECNEQADIVVTFTGANDCGGTHQFAGDPANLNRNFCLQGDAGPNAKLPYAVKAWGRNGLNQGCLSDFHGIENGSAFHLSQNCITQVGDTPGWTNFKTNLLVRISITEMEDKLHLPSGNYTDTLGVLVSWS